MDILLISVIALIVIGHTCSAIFSGIFSRVLTYITILLHPLALVPMLVLNLPFEAVAILFLGSALYYLAVSLTVDAVKKRHTSPDLGGDDA